jgi:hypothetical protein
LHATRRGWRFYSSRALTSAATALLVAASPFAALGQASATSISFQGVLNGTNGQPLPNGSYTLTFQFWDHPTSTAASNRVGGAVTVPGVAVNGGVASTAIPVQPEWLDGRTRYLGITVQGVNGSQELLPRVFVTAVPYALTAHSVHGPPGVFVDGNFYGPPIAGLTRVLTTFSDFAGIDAGQDSVSFQFTDGPGGIDNGYTAFNRKIAGAEFDLINATWRNAPVFRVNAHAADGPSVRMTSAQRNAPLVVDAYRSGIENSAAAVFNYIDAGLDGIAQFNYKEAIPGTFLGLHFLRCIWRNQPVFTVVSRGTGASVGIGTDQPQVTLDVRGITRTEVLQITSAREAKQGFAPVDAAAILAKVAALPLSTWAYTNAPTVRHLGPVAQDFHAAFALGDDDQHIATVDADGVALAAIQGLHQLLKEKEARLAHLESAARAKDAQITRLETRLTALEQAVERRLSGISQPPARAEPEFSATSPLSGKP